MVHFYENKISHNSISQLEESIKKDLLTKKRFNDGFDSVHVIYNDELSTFVPQEIFNKDYLKDYLKYCVKVFDYDFIAYDILENYSLVNVFIPYMNINNLLIGKFSEISFTHSSSILFDKTLQSLPYDPNRKLHIYVEEDYIRIYCISGTSLKFYNYFPISSNEDIVYYTLATIKLLELDKDNTRLYFSGKIAKEEKSWKTISKYIQNVEFLEIKNKYTFSNDFDKKKKFYLLDYLPCN